MPSNDKRRVAIVAGAGSRDRILSSCASSWTTTLAERASDLASGSELDAIVLCAQGAPAKALQEICERYPDPPVVVVVAELDDREVRGALAAGARGLLGEEDLPAALEPCLRAVIAGQVCVPSEQWRQVHAPALSTREKQVLGLVVMGYMNSQIAEQLFLAESTVKSHLLLGLCKARRALSQRGGQLILNPERGLGMGILGARRRAADDWPRAERMSAVAQRSR